MRVTARIVSLLVVSILGLTLSACTGSSSDTDTLSPGQGETLAAEVGQTKINVGMNGTQVLKLLGQPDTIAPQQTGEAWSFDRIIADFVYASGDTLVVGGKNSPTGQRFAVRVLMDASRKVADFTYVNLPF